MPFFHRILRRPEAALCKIKSALCRKWTKLLCWERAILAVEAFRKVPRFMDLEADCPGRRFVGRRNVSLHLVCNSLRCAHSVE